MDLWSIINEAQEVTTKGCRVKMYFVCQEHYHGYLMHLSPPPGLLSGDFGLKFFPNSGAFDHSKF